MYVYTYKSEKDQVSTLKKIWVDAILKKSQDAPYKNFGRFYKVPFKSLLRVKIKRANKEKNILKLWSLWSSLYSYLCFFAGLPESNPPGATAISIVTWCLRAWTSGKPTGRFKPPS